jgi:hypothetical protein
MVKTNGNAPGGALLKGEIMARLLFLAASAPLLLIGAAYPGDKPGDVYADEPDYVAEAPVTYRPCRPGPGDDHCIQLYERGVRAAYASWLRDRGGEARTEVAMGGPDEPVAHHRRHRDRHGERCVDHEEAGEARGM